MKGISASVESLDSAQGVRAAVGRARPSKLLGWLLQLTILAGAFYDAVEFIKPGLSTASITVTDLLLLVVYLVWLSLVALGRASFPSFSRSKSLYLFILALLVPILVGFSAGHLWQTVLRDARAPYYFMLSLVVMSFATDEKAVKKILWTLVAVGFAALVWDYLVYIFRIPVATSLSFQLLTTGRMDRHFGYHSSHLLLLACILLLANYLFVSSSKSAKAKGSLALLLFGTGLSLTLIRGLFVGMVFGLIVAVLIQKGKSRGLAILSFCFFVGFAAILINVSSPETMRKVVRIPVVERYLSIVDPSASSKQASDTAKARLEAVPATNKRIAESPFFGLGYGEYRKPRGRSDLVDPVLPYLVHSTPSWMLYRTGYVGTAALLLCLVAFFFRGFKSFRRSAKGSVLRLGYGTACASLVGICMASMSSNMIYGSERFSPLVAVIVGLLLSGMKKKGNEPPKPQTTVVPQRFP